MNKRFLPSVLLIAGAACAIASCGKAESTTDNDAAEKAGRLAKMTVMRQHKLKDDQFRLVETHPAEWQDTSLGCPEKGMQYQPAVTAGYRVKLHTSENTYEVHVSGERVVICSQVSGPVEERVEARDASVMNLALQAREDLISRLGGGAIPVRVVSMKPTEWPDASLGCPKPDEMYAQVVTPGFVIELQHDGETFVYHAGDSRIVTCDE